jgi:predicted Na+-dependent transporter
VETGPDDGQARPDACERAGQGADPARDVVKSLLLLVLLPLVVGLFIRARYADHVKDWQPELVKAANLALVVALAAGISANWSTIVSMFGSWVIVIVIVAGVLGVLLGLLLGGKSAEIRTTTGLVSRFSASDHWG